MFGDMKDSSATCKHSAITEQKRCFVQSSPWNCYIVSCQSWWQCPQSGCL